MTECKKYIIVFLVMLQCMLGHAQLKLNIDPAQLKENGKTALALGDYFSATDYLSKYNTSNSNDIEASYLLAEAYRYSNNYDLAKQFYAKVFQAEPVKYQQALFYYALMLKQSGAYDAAIEHFNRYLKEAKDKTSLLFEKASIELDGCMLAKSIDFEEAELRASIEPLNNTINKSYIELSPTYIDSNTILYASYPSDTLVYYKTSLDSMPKRRFFKAEKSSAEWEGSKFVEEPFNDPKFHVANGSYSKDKNRFYFTKCTLESNGKYICKIYVSQKINSKWMSAFELPEQINIQEYTNTQPTIQTQSDSVDHVFFVSDRNDGFGGKDLWYAAYNFVKNTAKDPLNLGALINTPFDEQTPFYHGETNTIYFSSNGHESLGGFDIFKTTGKNNTFSTAENLGYPYSTRFDDLYYVIDPNQKNGFLVSNRDGSAPLKNKNCCDDIFYFKTSTETGITYEGKVYNASYVERILEMEDDDKKNELIANEALYIIPNQKIVRYAFLSDGTLVPLDSTTSNQKGEFSFNINRNKRYKLIIERDGFFNKHHVFNTKDISGPVMKQHIGLVEITLDPIIIKNIYYPFDEWYLTKDAKTIIDTTVYEILIENPKLIIELSSHTDNFGSDDYNEILSQQRAESVVKYLIAKNIGEIRLRAKGYGEEQPIAPNANVDGSDNPEGRQKNRRTEFRVIGKLVNNKEIIYEE